MAESDYTMFPTTSVPPDDFIGAPDYNSVTKTGQITHEVNAT